MGKPYCALAASVILVSTFVLAASSDTQLGIAYWGKLTLPVSLYTGDGIQLEQGKFDIQIRAEQSRHFLLFLRNGEIISFVNGQSIRDSGQLPDLPLMGTVYLYPSDVPRDPSQEEKSSVTFIEHLKSRPWKAALRAYRHSDPGTKEVDFVLAEESKPGEWSQTEFKLFLSKPN